MPLDLDALLNPAPGLDLTQQVNVRAQLERLSALLTTGASIPATPAVLQLLDRAATALETQQFPSLEKSLSLSYPTERWAEHDVYLNQKKTLSTLYRYFAGAVVEYPESGTSTHMPVGHLFYMDPDNWMSPLDNIAYSKGRPRGGPDAVDTNGKEIFCRLLVDRSGNLVPCQVSHATCQGLKRCPRTDLALVRSPHASASYEEAHQVTQRRFMHNDTFTTLAGQAFEKTASYIASLQRLGCRHPPIVVEGAHREGEEAKELEEAEAHAEYLERVRHGQPRNPTCAGKIVYDPRMQATRCQYYSKMDPSHFYDHSLSNGSSGYDLTYIAAVLNGDLGTAQLLESIYARSGYGPAASCHYVVNRSSQRANCIRTHRSDDGAKLEEPLMVPMDCPVHFRYTEPLPQFRRDCPYSLLTSEGQHPHFPSIPTRTPPYIRATILSLIESVGDDLADLTPRRFIRHPITVAFLSRRYPEIKSPNLSAFHPSLANRDHIGAMIKYVQDQHFPLGTGWDAVDHLRRLHQLNLSVGEQYIRRMICVDRNTLQRHPDSDEDVLIASDQDAFRMVVCMTPAASMRLHESGQFLQSDISFKRVNGWYEFEMGCMDRRVNTGLGLYLQDRAASMPPKRDLSEPHRTVQELGPYEHLAHFVRLCSNHYLRNIKSCAVPNATKNMMRSLLCARHPDFEGTLARIQNEGGKAAQDWVSDKYSSGFAWAAICQQYSKIPLPIWEIEGKTTNYIESAHRDINNEGVHLTLLGGVQKGLKYDLFKQSTVATQEAFGVLPTYNNGYISNTIVRNLRRQDASHLRTLQARDMHVVRLNDGLAKSFSMLEAAQRRLHVGVERSAAKRISATEHRKLKTVWTNLLRERNQRLAEYRAKVIDSRTAFAAIRGTGNVQLEVPAEGIKITADISWYETRAREFLEASQNA
uniref:Uncharacterized protein n=1 Tax=Mycena chlorophos TaxID=658473 RepID=A0ABQ0L1H3_MYCCL|nr:predicted protein [Mycena chlorophos]